MSAPAHVIDKCMAIPGWMHPASLNWLYDRAAEANVVVEIGVWKGRSTIALCEACPGVVYAVDHFMGNQQELGREHAICQTAEGRREVMWAALCNLQPYMESGKCRMLPMPSAFVADLFDDADLRAYFVFIDGSHGYEDVLDDIVCWKSIVRRGGIIAGHDYDQPDVKRAVDAILGDVEVFKGDAQWIWWKRL